LKKQLVNLSHRVARDARAGDEMVKKLKTNTVALVITDILMEKLDGLDSAEIISARYGLPVILISAIDIDSVLHGL
jgi:YesN/AraC family two-component response regulator